MPNDILGERGCKPAQSWYELHTENPRDPLDLIAMASITGVFGTDVGIHVNSAQYGTPPTGWTTGSLPILAKPVCTALHTDNMAAVEDAYQWAFSHLTWDSNPLLAPSLRTLLFMRAGEEWQMTIPLNFGTFIYPSVEISLLENAATRGDCQGTIPVIAFNVRNYTGQIGLRLTFKNITGRFRIGIRAIGGPVYNPSNWYMWETELMLVK